MTRGNQREKAREKAIKKQKEMEKGKPSSSNAGMSLEERRHRDAEIMRLKQEKKNAGASGGATGGVSN